ELRESLALLPCCSESWIRIAKPVKRGIKKFIGRRNASPGALSVKRPPKYELRRTILFSSHSAEPMVDQRRFSDSAPGNNCHNINLLVCPCTIQEGDILLSTKNIASRYGQSGDGSLLRCKSCWRFARSETRNGRGRLQEALTSDSTPSFDSCCYRRHRFQQLARSLETLRRIFLKEFLKENYDWLWNIFESFMR